MSDDRTEAAAKALTGADEVTDWEDWGHFLGEAARILAAADAYDRGHGRVTIDTTDPALKQIVAEVLAARLYATATEDDDDTTPKPGHNLAAEAVLNKLAVVAAGGDPTP